MTIDRFDGRALLDFYREPDPSRPSKPLTEDEEEVGAELRRWLRAARESCQQPIAHRPSPLLASFPP